MTRGGLKFSRSSPRRTLLAWWPRVIDHRGITYPARGVSERRWWFGAGKARTDSSGLSVAFDKELGGPRLLIILIPIVVTFIVVLIGIEAVDLLGYATIPKLLYCVQVRLAICSLIAAILLLLTRVTKIRGAMERALTRTKDRLLAEGRCLACGYLFEVDVTDPAAINQCAECGAGWRAPIHRAPTPPAPARRRTIAPRLVVTDALGVERRSRWTPRWDGLRPPPAPGTAAPTARERWRGRIGAVLLALGVGGVAALIVTFLFHPAAPWWVTWLACTGFAILVVYLPDPHGVEGRELTLRAEYLLVGDPCLVCGTPLGEPLPQNGCTTCPGCGGVWRVQR